jgi:hypothetical protein
MFSIKKLFVLNLILCGIMSSTLPMIAAETTQKEWVAFTSKEGGFTVDLPKTPEHVSQKIDIPKTDLSIKYNTYVAEPSDSIVYVVSVWNYPSQIDMSKPEVNLADGFSGMLSALPGSEVLEKNVGDFNGFKALEFRVKNDDIYFQGKLILVHNTLYQVFTVYKEEEAAGMKASYKHFISTFQLVNPEQNKAAAPQSAAEKLNV